MYMKKIKETKIFVILKKDYRPNNMRYRVKLKERIIE